MKKIFLIVFYLLTVTTLNGCVQSSLSLFGPGMAIAKTGNIYQGGISYASNAIFVRELKMTPAKYIEKILTKDLNNNTLNNDKNNYDDFINAVKKELK
tara:strand:- start:122 stop:415 length:294 start_codon:yes stop_codon:yes gene_type:complete